MPEIHAARRGCAQEKIAEATSDDDGIEALEDLLAADPALASLPVHATASNTAKIAAFEPQYFEPQFFVTEEHSFGAPQRLRARVSSFTNCVSGLSGSAFPLHRQDQMEALESQMT